MQDLTPEQIIQMGQMYFPEMDPQQILDIFEQFKALMPKGSTNLEIAQVIKMSVDEHKMNKGKPQLNKLKELIGKR